MHAAYIDYFVCSSSLGVRLWRAHQYISPNEPGPSPLIQLGNLRNHVSRLEVAIHDVPIWATLGQGTVRLHFLMAKIVLTNAQ